MVRRPSERATSSEGPRGVHDVHLLETRGGTPVAYGVRLPRLALSVVERTAEPIRRPAADHVHRVPEVCRIALIGYVPQHSCDLPTAYLIESLAREREVVALVVDRPRADVPDHDAAVSGGNDIVDGKVLLTRQQRNVRHPLELHAAPRIGVRAAV